MTLHCQPKVVICPLNISSSIELSQLFAHFSATPWAMLLDSVDSQHPDANFDIMVAEPIVTITTKGSTSAIYEKDTPPAISHDNPLHLLENIKSQYVGDIQDPGQEHAGLPFLCGALGYFGYDLGRCFEFLPDHFDKQYQCPDMAVGIYMWSVIKNKKNGQFFLCSVDNHPTYNAEFFEGLANRAATKTVFTLSSTWQSNQSESQYRDNINKISDYLHAGDCYQINYAQRFAAQYQGDEWQAYLTLRKANNAPFSAFIRLEDSCILSISPERFLSLKDGQVQSKPIKGTRPRFSDPSLDLQAKDELSAAIKDQAENLMIVDLLRNDLSKHCKPHSVKVPTLFNIESFAAVHHLVSTVSGELDENSTAFSLFEGAFPGGSITGAPKIRAMQIIDELEPHKRNIYCGSIAYFGIRDDMDSSICIRTLLCEQQTIYCWAGGGIVIDSNAADEYQESLDKVAKILPVLTTMSKGN